MHDGRRDLILLLAVGATLAIGLAGCGRMPPPALWDMNAKDSAQVAALAESWKVSLESHFEDDPALSVPVNYRSDTTQRSSIKTLKGNPYKQHWYPGTFERRFDSLHVITDSVTATIDTTVTVKFIEQFVGHVLIRPDSATRHVKDTVINGISYPYFTITYKPRDSFSAADTRFPFPDTVKVRFTGTAARYLYLEPNNKEKRDVWVPKKISGGALYASPDDMLAPYLGSLQLVSRARRDTVVLRPDSLHYGIQRLYSLDSLLTFKSGDSIQVVMQYGPPYLLGNYWWDPVDVFIFLYVPEKGNPDRYIRRNIRIGKSYATFYVDSLNSGLNQIYIDIVPRADLTERVANYTSRIWGIPIMVKQ